MIRDERLVPSSVLIAGFLRISGKALARLSNKVLSTAHSYWGYENYPIRIKTDFEKYFDWLSRARIFPVNGPRQLNALINMFVSVIFNMAESSIVLHVVPWYEDSGSRRTFYSFSDQLK